MNPKPLLEQLCRGEDLSPEQSEALFGAVMAGEVEPFVLAGLLVALKAKGETAAEIAGAARAMRDAATRLAPTEEVGDSCGTGGQARQPQYLIPMRLGRRARAGRGDYRRFARGVTALAL